MAKENNLGDLLEGIANAIQTKGGTTAPINAQNFEKAILDLPSGGGVDLKRIGYSDEVNKEYNDYIENGIKYAEEILQEWNINNTSISFPNNLEIKFFPSVNAKKVSNLANAFRNCSNLTLFESNLDLSLNKNCNGSFFSCTQLFQVGDLGRVINLQQTFQSCSVLEKVGIIDLYDCDRLISAFSGANKLEFIKIKNWRKIGLSLGSKVLDISSINYLIEHALGVSNGAEQRTLTLDATAKARWQDVTQNPDYDKYAAMAAEKLITIA